MNNKGFVETHTSIEIPNDIDVAEKPLKTLKKRVDINILKSKLEETEAKELKKNIFILSLLIIGVGSFGIYLSF
tara:strand:- start:184 stop:405 length:222 start_codon:yes stop_codon:yes gene_type:complete